MVAEPTRCGVSHPALNSSESGALIVVSYLTVQPQMTPFDPRRRLVDEAAEYSGGALANRRAEPAQAMDAGPLDRLFFLPRHRCA
jgi:hypothetical protein